MNCFAVITTILLIFLYLIPAIGISQIQFVQTDTVRLKNSIKIKEFTMFDNKAFTLVETEFSHNNKIEKYEIISGKISDIEIDSIFTGYNKENGYRWITIESTQGKDFFYSYSELQGKKIIKNYHGVVTRLVVELPDKKAKKFLNEVW